MGEQEAAAREWVDAIGPVGDAHRVLCEALVGCARAVDLAPGKAALWKEYRELIRQVDAYSGDAQVSELERWRVVDGGSG